MINWLHYSTSHFLINFFTLYKEKQIWTLLDCSKDIITNLSNHTALLSFICTNPHWKFIWHIPIYEKIHTVKLCPFLLFQSKMNLPPHHTDISFRNLTRNSLRSKALKSYSMALKGTCITTSREKTHSLYFIRLDFFF